MISISEDISVICPFCFETIHIEVDATAGIKQSFTYDCEVCCRPIAIQITLDENGVSQCTAERES